LLRRTNVRRTIETADRSPAEEILRARADVQPTCEALMPVIVVP
jgi:hypothetical protein